MLDYLDIEELKIPIELKRAKRKTLAVTITPEGGLLIKAPEKMPEREIKRFLEQRRFWIYKQTKHMMATNADRIHRSEEEINKLREQARTVLTEKTDYYKSVLGVDYKRLRIGDQKTRWGSCSSKGNLNFNCLLMLAPPDVLDYVVVHELCHRKEMNHSKAFWNEVEKVLPNYKESVRWLKEEGSRIIQRQKYL